MKRPDINSLFVQSFSLHVHRFLFEKEKEEHLDEAVGAVVEFNYFNDDGKKYVTLSTSDSLSS